MPGAELLTVSGLAKTVWGGLRIGWLPESAQIIERLGRLKALADMGSAVLDQALAARLLARSDELVARRAHKHRVQLAHAGRLLRTSLPAWRWHAPDGGPALWIELPDADARTFATLSLRHGVEIVPGAITDPSGIHDSYIRVPYAFPPTPSPKSSPDSPAHRTSSPATELSARPYTRSSDRDRANHRRASR